MFLNPYDTTLESKVVLTKILQQVQLAKAEGRLVAAVENIPNIYAVVGKGPGVDSIPAFSHTLVDENQLYIDLRSHGAAVYHNQEYTKPTAGIPATLIKQAILQVAWMSTTQARKEMYHMSSLSVQVFSSWISELVTRRLALDDMTQMKLAALSAWYFICLFKTEAEFNHDSERGAPAAVKINRLLHIPIEVCQEIVEVGYLTDSKAFVDAVRGLGSLKLEQFNQGLLYSMVSGSWFGPKDMISVSFEHPPTFIAILHTVLNERGFHKTLLGASAQRHLKGDALQRFNQTFIATVRSLED